MGSEKKGIVMLFLKYQPSLASGPAAALTDVQIQLELLWTLPCLAQGRASPAHASRAARQGTALGQNTAGTERCWQQIPVCGEGLGVKIHVGLSAVVMYVLHALQNCARAPPVPVPVPSLVWVSVPSEWVLRAQLCMCRCVITP